MFNINSSSSSITSKDPVAAAASFTHEEISMPFTLEEEEEENEDNNSLSKATDIDNGNDTSNYDTMRYEMNEEDHRQTEAKDL